MRIKPHTHTHTLSHASIHTYTHAHTAHTCPVSWSAKLRPFPFENMGLIEHGVTNSMLTRTDRPIRLAPPQWTTAAVSPRVPLVSCLPPTPRTVKDCKAGAPNCTVCTFKLSCFLFSSALHPSPLHLTCFLVLKESQFLVAPPRPLNSPSPFCPTLFCQSESVPEGFFFHFFPLRCQFPPPPLPPPATSLPSAEA